MKKTIQVAILAALLTFSVGISASAMTPTTGNTTSTTGNANDRLPGSQSATRDASGRGTTRSGVDINSGTTQTLPDSGLQNGSSTSNPPGMPRTGTTTAPTGNIGGSGAANSGN